MAPSKNILSLSFILNSFKSIEPVVQGYFEAAVDYKYLASNYAQELSNEFQDYLTLKVMEQNKLKNNSYVDDGAITVDKNTIKDWLIAWYNFSKKYPDFKKDEVQHNIIIYTKDLIWSAYGTFDYSENNGETLFPEVKKAYEELLNEIDTDSEPYKYVKKYYDILKRNNFKGSDYFHNEYQKDFDKYGSYT